MIARKIFNFPTASSWNHPFFEMDGLRKEMNRLNRLMDESFPSYLSHFSRSGVFPALNITEDKDNYYVRAELPGIKHEDVDLQINGKNLTLKGKRETSAHEENIKYHRRERDGGNFSRGVGLPGDVDPDKVTASMVNGLLTITLGKAEAAKPRQIAIN